MTSLDNDTRPPNNAISLPHPSAVVIWPLVSVTGALVLSIVLLVGSMFLTVPSEQAAKVMVAMVEGHVIGRAIALFLIVPTIAILCVLDKVSGSAAIAALSAIAGYVLGGVGVEQVLK